MPTYSGGNHQDWSTSSVRDGAEVSDPDTYMGRMYAPQTGGTGYDSFEAINGQLQNDDLIVATPIIYRHLQRNSLCNGKMVGLTGNGDYRADCFWSESTGDGKNYRLIPGTGINFHLPSDSLVIFTWMIGGATSIRFDENRTCRMQLVIDDWRDTEAPTTGVVAPTGRRHLVDGVHAPAGSGTSSTRDSARIRRPHRDRVWAGHYGVELSAGWHKAGIAAYQRDRTLKFRVRNMKAIWFSKSPPLGE